MLGASPDVGSAVGRGIAGERPEWTDLPIGVRHAVEAETGAVVRQALRQPPRFTHGLGALLELGDGRRLFVKGVPESHPRAGRIRREAEVAGRLDPSVPTPRLLSLVDDEWVLLLFDAVEGTRPVLRPGSADIAAVLSMLGSLHRRTSPAPVLDAPEVLAYFTSRGTGWAWAHGASDLDPWVRRNLDALITVETAWHPWAAGDCLLHNDIRPDTMIRRNDGRVVLVDWSTAIRGAAWLDVAGLVPHLILAGHHPGNAERLVASRRVLGRIPGWALTGYATALAALFDTASRQAEQPGYSGLRDFQREIADAALTWVRHRTRLP